MANFKYLVLADTLRSQIENGIYKENERFPSENELAQHFNASRDTVRKAIAKLEEDGLVYKIKGSGTYPKLKKTTTLQITPTKSTDIGIMMNDINTYIFPSIIKGITGVLNERGYNASIHLTNNCISQERRILENFLNGDFAGLIIEPTKGALPQLNADLYQELASKKPTVIIHGRLKHDHLSNINMGNEPGAYELTKTLIEKGYRQIAIICKSDEQSGPDRYLGFVRAYQDAGIPIPDNNIHWFSSEEMPNIFSDPVRPTILKMLSSCSAILCHDDRLAVFLKKYLEEHPDIPKNVLICGFDNSDLAKEFNITSIAHPQEEFGRFTAVSLLKKINDPTLDVSYDFDPEIIFR